ncbi:hypothetical protein [Rhodococcus xishaensis]|uniref:DUF7159 domain-containing protein n=1 Tax=Rhodococcus xishaensis TaxID=2487364 RepID=A0A3S3BHD0_9NOCA|nr:hypothetical protein [Rhodococcus xishaensis]RVW01312.1 hypothetical protein EGT50_13935 [Rhodococcus xishaensis]
MSAVLGVSVGTGFVRMVQLPDPGRLGAPVRAERRSIAVDTWAPEELAAEAVGIVLADAAESGSTVRVSIAYSDEAQAAALDAALRRQGVTNFRLVPEHTAVFERLIQDERLATRRTLALYDLGSSGLTVSLVDRSTGSVVASERSTRLRGSDLNADDLNTDDLRTLPLEISGPPAIALIAESADLVGELADQSGSVPDVVVLLGGGTHAPEVRSVLQQRSAIPIVVAEAPEFTAATGAALLAAPVGKPTAKPRRPSRTTRPRSVSRLQVAGAVVAGVALVAIAVIGFGLGYGRAYFGPEAVASTEEPAQPAVDSAPR